jgi:hypothetical protein
MHYVSLCRSLDIVDADAVLTSPTVINSSVVIICQRLSLLRISPLNTHAFFLSRSVLHSVLISALARLDIALARSKAARWLLSVDPAPPTPFYNTLPPLKETPFGGGPTGPRLVVPGLTPSSFRLGLYTMVGLLSTTLLVVAVPILFWMFFVSPLPVPSVLPRSRLSHSRPSIVDRARQIRGIHRYVSICSGLPLTSVCNSLPRPSLNLCLTLLRPLFEVCSPLSSTSPPSSGESFVPYGSTANRWQF